MRLCVPAAFGLSMLAAPAAAQVPAGTANGYYVNLDGQRIELRHARVVLVDEATAGRPQEGKVHILLTERPAPPEALNEDGNSSPAADLARRGELRGVLLEFETRNSNQVYAFELDRAEDEFSLPGRSIDARGLWRQFSLGPHRFAARLETNTGQQQFSANPDAAFTIDAPLDYDPVVRILTGAEARDSEFVRTAVAVHDALLRGDLDAARRLSTREVAARSVPDRPLNAGERQFLQELVTAIRTPTRIVVRQQSATLVVGDETGNLWLDFALEDGQWRVD